MRDQDDKVVSEGLGVFFRSHIPERERGSIAGFSPMRDKWVHVSGLGPNEKNDFIVMWMALIANYPTRDQVKYSEESLFSSSDMAYAKVDRHCDCRYEEVCKHLREETAPPTEVYIRDCSCPPAPENEDGAALLSTLTFATGYFLAGCTAGVLIYKYRRQLQYLPVKCFSRLYSM